ncbi:MAG: carboxypeptidase regulatory-like domain-containing protein [Bryobacteraceae bacterium]
MRSRFSGVLVCLLSLAAASLAQEYRSTITGRVVDAQQAVVPGVKIAAAQVETGAKYETVSAADGQYTLPFLPPGGYTLAAEIAGFKKYVREGIQVRTNERLGLDITLEVGGVSDTVTVTAEAPALQTTTASTGQVINSRQIENMPLNGRTPLVLAQLSFGVIPSSNPTQVRPFDNSGPAGFSMGGAPNQTNELLMDGAPDTTANSRVAYNPPVDAVAELKVEVFQADAAYGHSGGGTVNMVLKGGTNALHGTAYEFNQVSALMATPFFTNRAGQKKVVTQFNQWGANAGGPIYIPKVLDGRNKLFFFFAYEGLRDGMPQPSMGTVPTAAERNGDFSELLKVGNAYQLYDPLTGVKEGSRVRRTPFANNIIPSSRLSPVGKGLLQFWPESNNPGRPDGQNNYISRQVERNFFNNELVRIDWNISDHHKIFGNYRHNNRGDERSFFNNIANGNTFHRTNFGALLDDVYTFTPTLLLNTRLNWTRFNEGNLHYSDGFDITTIGMPAALAAASPNASLPAILIDNYTSLADADRTNETRFDIFQVFTNLTKIAGRHSIKTGADLRLHRESAYNYGNSTGAYNFSTNWTRGPLDNATAAPMGQGLASLLLGLPTGGSFDLNATRTNQAGYYAFFFQDDVRVKPNLTLNLGLRYERDLPTVERWNRSVNGFDSTTLLPLNAPASAAYAKAPIPELPVSRFRVAGGPLFAGSGNRDFYRTNSHYFSPRFGFAWTPAALGGKTVLRGGTGVFVFPIGITGANNQLGFSQSTSLVATLDGYLTPAATMSNPFPNGIEQPTGSSLGLMTFAGKNLTYTNPNLLNPYTIRWTFDVQRELPWKTVFEIGYIGNHAVHLAFDRSVNIVPGNFYSASPVRDQAVIDNMTANVANPFANLIPGTGLNGSTVARNQLLKPFPQFTGVTARTMSDGSSYFHMLQMRLEKRFAAGLQLLANFQRSKLIEKRSLLNDFDTAPEKRIADEDRPYRMVLSLNYDLPFGRGKAIAPRAGRLANALVGGWNVNAIYVNQSGRPISWGNLLYYGGDIRSEPRNIDRAFDATRFNTNSREQLSWNVRRFPSRFANLRGDGPNNIDASVIKQFPIREKLKLQYRCELFNLMNHAQFSRPSTSATSSGFAKITGVDNRSRVIQMGLRMVW